MIPRISLFPSAKYFAFASVPDYNYRRMMIRKGSYPSKSQRGDFFQENQGVSPGLEWRSIPGNTEG